MKQAILKTLGEAPMTGAQLQQTLAADAPAFREAAQKLWKEGLIQGQLPDGCCSSPCGSMCVSYLKMEMGWQLSKKGRLRLKVMAAKGAS